MRPSHSGSKQRGASAAGVVIGLILVSTVAFFVLRSNRSKPVLKPTSLEDRYRQDTRISILTNGCGFGAPFDVDTTDFPDVLAGKLDAGTQLEAKNRAMRELASMGAEAAEALNRLFEDASKDSMRAKVAYNVLSVCALSKDDFGVQIALKGLQSPREDIRGEAAVVIWKHPKPELYDAIRDVHLSFTLPAGGDRCLKAMHACDEVRFTEELAGWLSEMEGREENIVSHAIDTAVTMLASSQNETVATRLRELVDSVEGLLPRHRIYMLAPPARFGDEAARQELVDYLASDMPKPRANAAEALAKAGLSDAAYVLAATSTDPGERLRVYNLIFKDTYAKERTPEQVAEVQGWAREALSEPLFQSRQVAMRVLLKSGDEEGRAYLMSQLAGTIDQRSQAAPGMRGTLDAHPELAAQIRANLISLWERERLGAQRDATFESIVVALASVPGRETGQFLLDIGDEVAAQPVKSSRGYGWFVGQTFNAGPKAREMIRERLATETDPFKRLDLIEMVWQDFEDASYEVLVSIVEDDSRSPYERVFAADQTLRMCKNQRFLPVLKRLNRSSTDRVLKPGVHCLLWAWFGPPVM